MNTTTADHDMEGRSALSKLWTNREARSVILQILTMAALIGFFAFILTNAVANLAAVGKTFSYDFLGEPASYDINQSLIDYTSRDTHLRAGVVGLLNTGLVAICGIVLATVLGFILGVLRLSPNFLLNKISYVFIEFTRNVPVLLHILLIHGIIVHALPHPKVASTEYNLADLFFLSNRGVFAPKPLMEPLFWATIIAFVVGVGFTIWFRRHAKKVQDETGKIYPVFWISVAAIIGLPVIVFFITGAPINWDVPEFQRFNFKGGMVVLPEFMALWLALSLYTAAFIGEIVRAGILSVSHGQWEAAGALGIRRGRILNLVIIPQALRVIIPPLTSQYLNLTKNSSLAIAIGYMDIVATLGGISLMQTGKEMETMILVIAVYLVISLMISAFMNWYNKRIKLVER
ncbi:MAG: ABC transporter permease subunit [Rhodospirillales bacterium]|nr:ABC transporter permease subunit [Rhodospirillales bacterium]MBO6786683.1 ABC transporter permease subunit [Rhodospirillales bacterium]